MTLATHAVVGASVAGIASQNPILAIIFAFLSHYLLDAFPHGHYKVLSHKKHKENPLSDDMVYGNQFLIDISKIGLDFALGIGLSFLFFKTASQTTNFIILAGALAGVLPDALQFVYWKIRSEPFIFLQKFHIANHSEKNFNDNRFKMVFTELFIITLAIAFSKIFIS